MPKTQSIVIDLIQLDGDTQNRVTINEDTVQEYCELIEAVEKTEWPFPPCDVYHDGNEEYYPSDGFHRILAAVRAKRCTIPCVVHKGTAKDARIAGMTANDRHGLRMTRADKRRCVEWLLDQPGRMAQKVIAEKAGVTLRTVQRIVLERREAEKPPEQQGEHTTMSHDTPTGSGGKSQGNQSQGGRSNKLESRAVEPEESDPPDTGDTCPNCGSENYNADEDGLFCDDCKEPVSQKDGAAKTQRQKTIKTCEALQRAFDDLQELSPNPTEHKKAETGTKALLKIAKAWKVK